MAFYRHNGGGGQAARDLSPDDIGRPTWPRLVVCDPTELELRRICRAEGLPEPTLFPLLGMHGAVCHPATAEVITQAAPSKFLLLHELAHLKYRQHGREHSDLWLHLMERYLSDSWRDER